MKRILDTKLNSAKHSIGRFFSSPLRKWLFFYQMACVISFFILDIQFILCWIALNVIVFSIVQLDGTIKFNIQAPLALSKRATVAIMTTVSKLVKWIQRVIPHTKEPAQRIIVLQRRVAPEPSIVEAFPPSPIKIPREQLSMRSFNPDTRTIVRDITAEKKKQQQHMKERKEEFNKALNAIKREESSPKKFGLQPAEELTPFTLESGDNKVEGKQTSAPLTPLQKPSAQVPAIQQPSTGLFGSGGGIFGQQNSNAQAHKPVPQPQPQQQQAQPQLPVEKSQTPQGLFGARPAAQEQPPKQDLPKPEQPTQNKPNALSGGLFNPTQQQAAPKPQASQLKMDAPPQNAADGSSDDKYKKWFDANFKEYDNLRKKINDLKQRNSVTRLKQLPAYREKIGELIPWLGSRFTTQLADLVRASQSVADLLEQSRNDQTCYQVMIQYLIETILSACKDNYNKNKKLIVLFYVGFVLIVNKRIPYFAELILIAIASEYKVLAGRSAARPQGMNDKDYWEYLGFEVDNGQKDYVKYSETLESYAYVYFLICTVKLEMIFNDSPEDERHSEPGTGFLSDEQIREPFLNNSQHYDWIYWSFVKEFLKMPMTYPIPIIMAGFYRASHYPMRLNKSAVIRVLKKFVEKLGPDMKHYMDFVKSLKQNEKHEERELNGDRKRTLQDEIYKKWSNVDPKNPNAPSIKGPFEESKDAANLAADE